MKGTIFESLFEHNTDLIFIVNEDGIILDANPAVRDTTGYNIAELKGKPFHSLLHNDLSFQHFLNKHTNSSDYRINIQFANGELIGCLLKLVPIYQSNKVSGYFIIVKDMRELDKIAEQCIPTLVNFKSITENVLDVIIIMDEQKNYLYVSPSSKEMFGFNYERMNDYEAYFNIHPDHVRLLNECYEMALATGKPFDIDVQAHHTERGWIWTKILGKAVYDDEQQFKHMLLIARDISKEKELESELKFYAYHDSLTSIPNRRYLREHLLKQIRHLNDTGDAFAVALLDIDDFKNINDSYGHEIGDAVIQEFAYRLEELMVEKGIVARLGGDEFILLINDINVIQHIQQFEQSIHQTIKAPFTVQATHLNVTTSIGITLCNHKGLNQSLILRTVDEALYEVKRAGKNKTVINIIQG